SQLLSHESPGGPGVGSAEYQGRVNELGFTENRRSDVDVGDRDVAHLLTLSLPASRRATMLSPRSFSTAAPASAPAVAEAATAASLSRALMSRCLRAADRYSACTSSSSVLLPLAIAS